MRAIHNPPPHAKAGNLHLVVFLLTTAANVGGVAVTGYDLFHKGVIKLFVHAQVLFLLRRAWTGKLNAVQRGFQQFAIRAVGSIDRHGQGDAGLVGQDFAFGTILGAVGGIGANRLVAKGALVQASSAACQSHWMPLSTSYSLKPSRHSGSKPLAAVHFWK